MQGPNITENYFAGLAIDGSANVTIADGNFSNNWAGDKSATTSGAMVVRGNAVVEVEKSTFTANGFTGNTGSEETVAGMKPVQACATVCNQQAVTDNYWHPPLMVINHRMRL